MYNIKRLLTRRFGPVYCGIDHGTVPIREKDWKAILEYNQRQQTHSDTGSLTTLTPEKWERLLKRLEVS